MLMDRSIVPTEGCPRLLDSRGLDPAVDDEGRNHLSTEGDGLGDLTPHRGERLEVRGRWRGEFLVGVRRLERGDNVTPADSRERACGGQTIQIGPTHFGEPPRERRSEDS